MRCLAVLVSLLVSGSLSLASAEGAQRPNIILIITDDQGYGDLGFHGNSILKTPHLDRLAEQSVELTHFYVNPVCAPTRASLFTGRYTYRTGVWETYLGGDTMRLDEITIPELLHGAGYRTGIFGKWHLGEIYPWVPREQGFEEGLYFRHGNIPEYFDAVLETIDLKPSPSSGYITDVLTDAAIEFLGSGDDRPFFLYLPYNAPHYPLIVPDRYLKPYLDQGLEEKLARTYAMVACLDENVGRLLAEVEKRRLADNTIIFFMTDNGPQDFRYNAELRGRKGQMYEGGIRAPFLARWPGRFPAGSKIAEPSAVWDLLPTILDLCDVEPSPFLDGTSLTPLLRGVASTLADRFLFFHWQRSMQPKAYPKNAVRNRRFKLVDGKELYDLQEDPREANDVSSQYPEMVKDFSARYQVWWDAVTAERGFVVPATPVGYPQENPAILLAQFAHFQGNIKFNDLRLLQDHLGNWISTEDSASWEVEVIRGGEYEVLLSYRCSQKDAGSRVQARVGSQTVEAIVTAAGDQRKWAQLSLGRLDIPVGTHELHLKALEKPGATVMDLHQVELKLIDN